MSPLRLSGLRRQGQLLQMCIRDRDNPMPESVKDRCARCYEHIFLFSKSKKYFFDSVSYTHLDVYKRQAQHGSAISETDNRNTASMAKTARFL